MANLFTDALSIITLQDIEEFLNLQASPAVRPTEGVRLDFKQGLPQDLGWDVAAFSNGYGGIILIGVGKDPANKGAPGHMTGADLGNDPTARLVDTIIATVHPRPALEVRAIALPDSQKCLALVRIAAGAFPPYEYSKGATVGVPIRVGDTTRQATLREIEALLRAREMAARPREAVIESHLNESDFYCSLEWAGVKGGPIQLQRDPQFQRLILAPRIPQQARLDLSFERTLVALIRDVYRWEENFRRATGHEQYKEGVNRHGLFVEYEFRISGDRQCHRVWRVWLDGSLGFTGNHSRIRVPEPAGNFALEALLFLRLARRLYEGRGFFGPSVMAYTIGPSGSQFSPEFRSADFTRVGVYDHVEGLHFDGEPGVRQEVAAFVEDIDWETILRPEEFVTSALLDLFRALAGARIDYEALLGHVTRLSNQFP